MPFTSIVETAGAWGDGSFGSDDVLAPVGIALDCLDVVADPVSGLVGQALDFLLEPLVDYAAALCPVLDALWGAPDQITEYSARVHDASAQVAEAASGISELAAALTVWTGAAADAYREVLRSAHQLLSAQSRLNANSADLIAAVGVVAAMIKQFLWDLIIDVIAKWVTQALIALAAAIPSLGTTIAAYTAWVTASYAWLWGKCGMFLSEAADEVDDIAEALGVNNQWLDSLEEVFERAAAAPITPDIPRWVGPAHEGAGHAGGTWGDPHRGITPFPA